MTFLWGEMGKKLPSKHIVCTRVSKLSVKGQTVNVSGFVGHMSVAKTQLCHYSEKTAISNM